MSSFLISQIKCQREEGSKGDKGGKEGKGGGKNGKIENIEQEGDFASDIATKIKQRSKRPSLYKVILLNDDYTPMEFVVYILQELFHKSHEEAVMIMLTVHNHGMGECGVFPYEVAEAKVTQVMDLAKKDQHPLKCIMEKQY